MNTVSIQLPKLLAKRLRDEAHRRQLAPEAIVREALERTLPLHRIDTIGDAQNFAEAAERFIGRFTGPSDLATNPRYLEDLGR